MTIEEKAKRYDEAIEIARALNNGEAVEGENGDTVYECIFHELKESKGEKIRKEILKYIRKATGCKEWIAWLEKQDEQKSQRMISAEAKEALFDFKDEIQQEDSAPKTESNFLFKVKYDDKEYNVKGIANGSVYEAEDETNNIVYLDSEYCEIIRGGYGIKENGSPYPTKSATFSEQESNDEIEPNFKVGDWVVRKDGKKFGNGYKFAQITTIDKEQYWFDSGTWLEKEEIRLWSIQDAKDGDILSYVTDEGDLWIMIYQSLYKPYEGHVHYHKLLVDDILTDEGTCCISIDNLKPATIEQRDILFQKMKNADYEQNSESKEVTPLF